MDAPNEDFLEINLELYKKQDALTPLILSLNPQPNTYFFCKTEQEELNLVREENGERFFFHDNNGALAEAKAWFQNLNLSKIKVLVIFGLGLGYYYDATKDWLNENPDTTLIFLEDDIHSLRMFLQTAKATEILENPQVKIIYKETLSPELFQDLFLTKHTENILVEALNLYKIHKRDKLYLLGYQIYQINELSQFMHLEYMLSRSALTNLFYNLLNIPTDYDAPNLFGKFKGIPAIICGAGPSLIKQIPLLKELKNKALIFSGGSSLNILNSNDVFPHFGAGVDPNVEQFHRLFTNDTFVTPFFYDMRMFNNAAKLIQGDRLRLKGSEGYTFPEWFEQKLGIKGEKLGGGYNVINFCTTIAKLLGCDPIIFVGLDLAYTEEKTYANGICRHPLWLDGLNPYQVLPNTTIIERNDIYGNRIKTKWMWIRESLHSSNEAIANPQVRFINATEGGIGFAQIPNIPLKEVSDIFLQKEWDLQGKIHAEIQNNPFSEKANITNILFLLKEFNESMEKAKNICGDIFLEAKKMQKRIEDDEELPPTIYSGKAVLNETLLGEQVAYRLGLVSYDEVFLTAKKAYLSRHKKDNDPKNRKKNLLEEVQELQDRYKFLLGVCEDFLKVIQEVAFLGIRHSAVRQDPSAIIPKPIIPEVKGSEKKESLYPSGKIKHVEWSIEGKLHGSSQFFSEDGSLLSHIVFVDGKPEGEAFFFYPTGVLYSHQLFKRGEWNGKQTFFYENGGPRTEIDCVDGKYQGDVKTYFRNGQIHRFLQYENGKRHGEEKMWQENSNLLLEAHYTQGIPSGLARQWDPQGKSRKDVIINKYPAEYEMNFYDVSENLMMKIENGKENWSLHKKLASERSQKVLNELQNVLEKSQELLKILSKVQNKPEIAEQLQKIEDELKFLGDFRLLILEQAKGIDEDEPKT